MAFLLRKVDRKRRFDRLPWLPEAEIQADSLREFATRNNSLSLWEIESDCSNLSRIIAALGARRDSLDKFDYALIDRRYVDDLAVQLVPRPGVSSDPEANERWHQEMVELSGRKIFGLATLMTTHAKVCRITRRSIEDQIRDFLDRGFIDPDAVSDGIRAALER